MEKFKHLFFPSEGKSFFIPVFLAFYVVYRYLLATQLELSHFQGRMIGIATLEKIDIAKRVGLFTNGLFYFLLVFAGTYFLLGYLQKKGVFSMPAVELLKQVSVGGLFILFFGIFGIGVKGSLSFVLLFFILISFLELLAFFTKSTLLAKHEPALYVFVLSLSICSYFLVMEVTQLLLSQDVYIPLHPFMLLISCGLVIFFRLLEKKYPFNWSRLLYQWFPLLFLPILSFFADEIYLVMNNRGINAFTPARIYLLGVLMVIAFLAARFVRSTKKKSYPELSRFITNAYLPMLLIGLGIFTFYQPFLEVRNELFELGNPALGIQRWHLFDEIPLLETFNSHLFAELFYGFLYTLINGFSGVEYNLYYFLNRVIYGLVCYYFFYKTFRHQYLAFFLVIFFAYLTTLVPRSFYTALLAIFVLELLFQKQRKRDHYLFFIAIVGLIIWRIDIGFANLIALSATSILVYLLSSEKPLLRNTWKAGSITFGSILLLVSTIAWIKGIPLIQNAQKALHYLSSTQTYGYLNILPAGLAEKEWHYFVFPAVIASLGVYLLLELKKGLKSEYRFTYIASFYLVVFYLTNLQRGIVRHGLLEGSDEVHTSFGYLIIALIPFLVLHQYGRSVRQWGFIAVAVVVISAFRYGGVKNEKNLYQLLGEKIESYSHVTTQTSKINRALFPQGFAEENFLKMEAFFDEYLSDTATFLDFSNTPMLYFYTNRRVPSYFNQNLLSIHDDFLQDAYLKNLKNFNVPVVVYANYPRTWFDQVDGVPNDVRHYRIAEHLFKNYHPAGILNKHAIWVTNEKEEVFQQAFQDSLSLNYVAAYKNLLQTYSLRYLPMIWAAHDEKDINKKVLYDLLQYAEDATSGMFHFSFPATIDKSSGNYLYLVLQPGHNMQGQAEIVYGTRSAKHGVFNFQLSPARNEYLIRLSTQYRWTADENNFIQLKLPVVKGVSNDTPVLKAEIVKGD